MQTTLPSWLAHVPHNLGSAGHGKLTADQWRTTCCVHLVITLCRLWGTLSASRQREMLDNFLALVTTVRWATMRSVSENHITTVNSMLLEYLTGIVKLYGEHALIPSHHLSLHLPECLHSFGPVHSWWAFPFERYNGILRGKNMNNKLGMSTSQLIDLSS